MGEKSGFEPTQLLRKRACLGTSISDKLFQSTISRSSVQEIEEGISWMSVTIGYNISTRNPYYDFNRLQIELAAS